MAKRINYVDAEFWEDIGNADEKGLLEIDGFIVWTYCPHAIVELPLDQLPRLKRSDDMLASGYMLIERNGEKRLFAYGDTAKDEDQFIRQVGAERYIEGYFDVLSYAVLVQCLMFYEETFGKHYDALNLRWNATHAPQDFMYRQHIRDLLYKDGDVVKLTSRYGELTLKSKPEVSCMDEPLGGFYNYGLTKDFEPDERLNPDLKYVIFDGGGYTFDIAEIVNFEVNPNRMKTHPIGILNLYDQMKSFLRTTYPDEFRKPRWNEDKLAHALIHGKYKFGKSRLLNCEPKAGQLRTRLSNDFSTIFEGIGGVDALDVMLLTGGATVATFPILSERYHEDIHVRCSQGDMATIRYSNLRGFYKMTKASRVWM